MNFRTHLLTKQAELTKEITALEKFIAKLPESKLIARQKGGNYYYYKKTFNTDIPSSGNRRNYEEIYLPKESKEALTLAKGEYSVRRLADAKKELSLVNQYLKLLEAEPSSEHFLSMHPAIKSLLVPSLKNSDGELENWQTSDYYKNPYRPEMLIYPTVIPGLKVRSKSEADILARLTNFKVPFHYEEGFLIGGKWRFPDITCRALSSPHKQYYWEHLGGLSSFKYFEENMNKVKDFYSCGLVPWKNLIITTETDGEPLDINWVDEIIKYYLL